MAFETEKQKRTIRELPAGVWEISKLTDVDRHSLSQHWRQLATAYEPKQFHVSQNGLALLVAYVLHLLDVFHATIPKGAAHHRVVSPRAARGIGVRLPRMAVAEATRSRRGSGRA